MSAPTRRALLTQGAATLAAATLAAPALAQGFPTRPLRLIVPFAPGGGTDTTARIVAQTLGERLGQSVVVENRPGAGGAIGMAAAAQAAADGYTLVMGHVATHVVNMAVHQNPGYDTARDFVSLGITSTAANILVVNPQRRAGIMTARDLVEAARAKPGELSFGSAGVGSPAHITTALFLREAEVEAVHVPYRGGAPATTDLVAGNLDFMFSGASDCIPHIRSGRLRGIAAASARRLSGAPEIPTIAESGWPEFSFEIWHVLSAHAGTPPAVLERLRSATAATLNDATVIERIGAMGVDATPTIGDAAEARVRQELGRWVPLIRAAGITAQ
ncbi:Bug family tripartite tricarboxylate transporter substrate binding protein [Falsiroseomonas sp. E2-1-a20]|uniref:Bug family tripartite tricarboxylate transporter substrate binding protein n=1 Tax=Falsiroseomonas sp. E2-1-a20 TaxID=3239300 RepID=UPI003F3ED62E